MSAITFGTPELFSGSVGSYVISAAMDSTHSMVIYTKSNGLYAKVCTVTGTSISYGSEYAVYESDTNMSNLSATALDSTHVVIVWNREWYSQSKSVIATVANVNEISFGTIYQMDPSDYVYEPSVHKISSTKFLVSYSNSSGSYSIRSIVGTVSNGNEIAYGSVYQLPDEANAYMRVSALLDSTHFAVSFTDSNTNPMDMNNVIGTISGTEISYGTVYTFNSSSFPPYDIINSTRASTMTALSSSSYVITFPMFDEVGYVNSYTAARVCTVTGSDISFGDEQEITSPAAKAEIVDCVSDKIGSSSFLLSYVHPGSCYYFPDTDPSVVSCSVSAGVITVGDEAMAYDGEVNIQYSSLLSPTLFVLAYITNTNNGYCVVGQIPSGARTSAPLPMFRTS